MPEFNNHEYCNGDNNDGDIVQYDEEKEAGDTMNFMGPMDLSRSRANYHKTNVLGTSHGHLKFKLCMLCMASMSELSDDESFNGSSNNNDDDDDIVEPIDLRITPTGYSQPHVAHVEAYSSSDSQLWQTSMAYDEKMACEYEKDVVDDDQDGKLEPIDLRINLTNYSRLKVKPSKITGHKLPKSKAKMATSHSGPNSNLTFRTKTKQSNLKSVPKATKKRGQTR